MSESAEAAFAGDVDGPADLSRVPLLAGMGERELAGFAGVLRRFEFRAEDVLWREGDAATGLHLIIEGRIAVSRRLPGGRELELAVLGPDEVLGELALLGDGWRAASARAVEPVTTLFLSKLDFSALVERHNPTAMDLKRRLAHVVCDRLRRRHGVLAELLGGAEPRMTDRLDAARLEPVAAAGLPAIDYLRRLQFFRGFEADEFDEILSESSFVECDRGRLINGEGEVPEAGYVTINGAVAGVIERGDRRIRVELAGPGCAFGYAHAIGGGPSTIAAVSRERTRLMVVPRSVFERFFNGDAKGSRAFLDAIQRDLVAALHQAERPQARLALFASPTG